MLNLNALSGRGVLYNNIDGLGEVSIGIFVCAYSLLSWLEMHSDTSSIWHSPVAFPAVIVLLLLGLNTLNRTIKSRFTYPRTGYVEYRRRDKYWRPLILGAATSAILSAGLFFAIRHHLHVSSFASLAVVVLAAGAYIRIAGTATWKWVVLAVMLAALVGISYLPTGLLAALVNHSNMGTAIPAETVGAFWLGFLVFGALLLVSGAISFCLYLRNTTPPTPEAE